MPVKGIGANALFVCGYACVCVCVCFVLSLDDSTIRPEITKE